MEESNTFPTSERVFGKWFATSEGFYESDAHKPTASTLAGNGCIALPEKANTPRGGR